MKALRIVQCSDGLMWYNQHVGAIVPFLRQDTEYFWSREPAGYSNIVLLADAEVIEIASETEIKYNDRKKAS